MELGKPYNKSQYPTPERGPPSMPHYTPKGGAGSAVRKRHELSKTDIFFHIVDSLRGLVRRV